MLNVVDTFLDGITMYRLVLYYLIVLVCIALVLSFFSLLPFSPFSLIVSTVFILFVCYVSNTIFSLVYEVPVNVESWVITALILVLIITPTISFDGFAFLGWAALLAMASKYIVAINKKHLFNPAALAVVLTSIGIGQAASWWVGTALMAPVVVCGGLLIIRKIEREDMVFTFFAIALLVSSLFGFLKGTDFLQTVQRVTLDSPLFFFGFVILTEPLTTPPTKKLQEVYGGLVGLLFAPAIHVASIYSTPELALVVGNMFTYLVSPKEKLMLTLTEKFQIGTDIIDFIFPLSQKIHFAPGQYMEWTLPHKGVDSRGNRRYFTIASSPTEDILRLGIKFYQNGSSYKKALANLNPKTMLIGSQVAGEFILPRDPKQKCVFIAGGIGITPFRSMMKYLLDTNEKRDIVLLYSNKRAEEIMYTDVFTLGQTQLGIKTVYTLTNTNVIPPNWKGKTGRIDTALITSEIPDYNDRLFYLSGPHEMVKRFEQVLNGMHIPSSQIKIDFFPGFV